MVLFNEAWQPNGGNYIECLQYRRKLFSRWVIVGRRVDEGRVGKFGVVVGGRTQQVGVAVGGDVSHV